MTDPLPIDDILPALIAHLQQDCRAVVQAPPGAGKTTRVPLAMRAAKLTLGKIIMLEPRRLAAQAAATRMAETLGERPGETVGYRIRGKTMVGPSTQIEVVTEGILTRMLQTDPELPGVGAVIFDEFHERSLNADLGLALCLEVADVLRDDLILLVMSATLDAAPVAALMNAPIVTSAGRSYAVNEHFLPHPLPKDTRFDVACADLITEAVTQTEGAALAFLPGEGEIRRVQTRLAATLPDGFAVLPLYGALPFKEQQAALRPITEKRKIVLATSIAETSLTIPDIRIVIDGGKARRAVFDPGAGMERLVTTRVTRAEATQRAGRAGRVAEGVCHRLWSKGEHGALDAFPAPEIAIGDLASFALELAIWGSHEDDLRLLTPPNAARLSEARAVLQMLGALSADGRITDHGKAIARQPLHPRLAHMLITAGSPAAMLSAYLSERDPMRDLGNDLDQRLRILDERQAPAVTHNLPAIKRIQAEAKRLARGLATPKKVHTLAEQAALAYPDRIALRRSKDSSRYVLANGKGAAFERMSDASSAMIVATDLDPNAGRDFKIRQAISLPQSSLAALFPDQITDRKTCYWSKRDNKVLARAQTVFGALVFEDKAWTAASPDMQASAMLDGVRQLGLRPSDSAARYLARARMMPEGFPDFSEMHLMETLEDWLLPHLGGVTSADAWKTFDLLPALRARLSWDEQQQMDKIAPSHFETPLGRSVPIDYSDGAPAVSLRLQEVFGVTRHPTAGGIAVAFTLLSPAQRPIQVTSDLPGFWATSYADVRKDMRGRYPKHPWPEDPTQADPTLLAKRRS